MGLQPTDDIHVIMSPKWWRYTESNCELLNASQKLYHLTIPPNGGRGENRTLTDVSPMVSKTIVSTSSTTRPKDIGITLYQTPIVRQINDSLAISARLLSE